MRIWLVILGVYCWAQLPDGGGSGVGGGGTGAPPYQADFSAATSVTVTEATHGQGTKPFVEGCWDNATPRNLIALSANFPTVAANGDVVASWTGSKTGYCLIASGSASGTAGGDLTGTYPNPSIAASVTITTPTLVTPAVADLSSMTHTHQNAAGGGNLNAASVFNAGAVPVARGGTNLGSYTAGDLIYATGATVLARLGIGTNGQCLVVTAGAPTWDTCAAGSGLGDPGGNGVVVRTSLNTTTPRTITGTATKIAVSNGDGVSGNPTITIPDSVTLVTPTISATGFANAQHAHEGATSGGQLNATNVFSAGTMPTARLASGTANSSTFLRGDQTWATPAGAGDVVGPASATDEAIPRFDGTTGKILMGGPITFSDTGAITFPDGVKQTFNPNATNAGLNVGVQAGDPSTPADGDLVYNSSTPALRARINGAWVSLGAAGGGITSLGGQTGATQTITRGVGIGGSSTTDDHSFTVDLSELINSQTIWDSSQASRTLTAGLSGATDPVLTFANNSLSLNVPVTAPGLLTSGGSVAGFLEMTQGTACTPSANSVCEYAPASIGTAYGVVKPSAVGATGVVKVSVSGATATLSHAAIVDADVPNDITVDLATLASTVTVVDSTDATSFVAIFDSATGSLGAKTDGNLTYNASNGTLTAVTFSGALSGNATTATALAADPAGCTNQFTRDINASGTATCASVATADISDDAVTRAKVSAILRTRQAHFKLWGTGASFVLQDADDELSIFNNQLGGGITITEVTCEADTGTPTIQLQRDDGSAADILSSALSCATTPASTTTFSGSENQIADGQRVDFLVGTAGGAAHWVAVTITYTVD